MDAAALSAILRRVGVADLQPSRSGWMHGRCPLAPWTHPGGRDAHPSFAVLPDTGGVSAFSCFSCKSHGRISGLIRKLHDLGADVGEVSSAGYPKLAHEADAADAAGVAARPFATLESRVEAPPEPIDEALFDGVFPPAWDVPEARSYLIGRGVGEDTAISLGLGWDATQRRVVFPVRDRKGDLFGFTGRAVDPDAKPKIRDYYGLPKRHLILGEERWRGEPWDNRPLVLVEGLFGYAHLVEMGLESHADVGALLGSVLTEQKAARVRMRAARTYLLMDNDRAGDVCLFGPEDAEGNFDSDSGAVAMLMRDAPVYVPVWPGGKDDPDQLTRREVWEILRHTPRFQDMD